MNNPLLRFLDFVLDPRMPHNFLGTALRNRKLLSKINTHQNIGGELFVALTFDVENEYGSHRLEGGGTTVRPFLEQMRDWDVPATIFVEGCLVGQNADILLELERNEIENGLHGFRHELWGPAQWFLADRPVSSEQKTHLLEVALEDCRAAGLRRPVVFRAPNLTADNSTIELLGENGFQVDSSLPSHRGVLPVPQFPGGLKGIVRIPVTADPIPFLARKSFLPYCRFRVCNLKNLKEITLNGILDIASRIISIQELLGCLPHLVVLSHSWEFSTPLTNDPKYGYCSVTNYEFLREVTNWLRQHFKVRFVSMSDLGKLLAQEQRGLSS